MQRNIRAEIFVAAIALILIAFVFVSAIFLSNTVTTPTVGAPTLVGNVSVDSNLDNETATVTTIVSVATIFTATVEVQSMIDEEATATSNAIDTVQVTNTSRATATPRATNTLQVTNTPRATNTLQVTNTPRATNTAQAANTPRATNTAQAANTPRATNTLQAANTPRSTATPRPTNTTQVTNTPRATNTPRTTAAPGVTNAVTATRTPRANITPTDQPSVRLELTPSRTPTNCQLPNGWATYMVEPNNTLFAISLAVNSTVEELRTVNCLVNADNIRSGQMLFVPRLPINPVSTLGTGSVGSNRAVMGCISPETLIISPTRLQRLNNVFVVLGTASRADFWYYKLEVRLEGSTTYNFYSDSYVQVSNGVLGEINPKLFGAGEYWIRLSVVDIAGRILTDMFCEVPVIFE